MNHLNLDFNESTTNAEYKALLSYEGVVTLSVAFIFELTIITHFLQGFLEGRVS